MTATIDTLRRMATIDPYRQDFAQLGEQETFRRFDEAGVLGFLARHYDDRGARNLLTDRPNQQITTAQLDRTFYQGKGGRYFLRADIYGRADGSKIADAAIERVARVDPALAWSYKEVQDTQGGEIVFQQMASRVRALHALIKKGVYVDGVAFDLARVHMPKEVGRLKDHMRKAYYG